MVRSGLFGQEHRAIPFTAAFISQKKPPAKSGVAGWRRALIETARMAGGLFVTARS
jgi:hypothetical protein